MLRYALRELPRSAHALALTKKVHLLCQKKTTHTAPRRRETCAAAQNLSA